MFELFYWVDYCCMDQMMVLGSFTISEALCCPAGRSGIWNDMSQDRVCLNDFIG